MYTFLSDDWIAIQAGAIPLYPLHSWTHKWYRVNEYIGTNYRNILWWILNIFVFHQYLLYRYIQKNLWKVSMISAYDCLLIIYQFSNCILNNVYSIKKCLRIIYRWHFFQSIGYNQNCWLKSAAVCLKNAPKSENHQSLWPLTSRNWY